MRRTGPKSALWFRTALVACIAAAAVSSAVAQPAPAPTSSPATPATLRGRAIDAATRHPLPFANVAFYLVDDAQHYPDGREAGGMLTQRDGTFSRELVPGTYRVIVRYVSYERVVLTNVVVQPGSATEITAALDAKPIIGKKVVVQGQKVRDKESALLAQRQRSESVSDAISSEQMAKSSDSNAAEALGRVTGLSVVDGKYVFVRGLGERYSSTQLNGAGVGTPEPNKRVLPLDLFPASLLDNIVVQKTFTPDMEGEFGGGVVDINTKDFQERSMLAQSMSVGLTPPGETYMGYPGGKTDWLGFDDGTRALPDLIETSGKKRITKSNYPLEQIKAMGRSFDNVWSPSRGGSRPNLKYSGLGATRLTLLGREVGLVGSLSLANDFESAVKEENVYEGSAILTPRSQYRIHESSATVLGGATGNISVKMGENNALKLNVLYTRHSDDITSIAEGPNNDFGSNLRATQLSYVERGLLSTVLKSSQPLQLQGATIDWNVSYSTAKRNEPDRRESLYEDDGTGTYQLSRRFTYPVTRIFGRSVEYDAGAKANCLVPITASNPFDSKLKFGLALRNRTRSSSFRRFGFTSRGSSNNSLDRSQQPEALLAGENLDAGYFLLEESTKPNDSYDASHQLLATYAMVDMKLWQQVRVVAGARLEESTENVEASSPFVDNSPENTTVDVNTRDVLPAYNLTWSPHRATNLRLAYSTTLARPELRELSPFAMYNFESGYNEIGNPGLVTSYLRNYDARWEIFPSRQEIAAVSFFYKKLDHPIEKYITPDVGGYALSPVNGLGGELQGLELELRAAITSPVRWVTGWRSGSRLDNWGFMMNYSKVRSSVRLEAPSGEVTTPLNGQSDKTLNLGLFYGSQNFDGALLYKSFGKRLSSFGLGILPDIYEHPLESLDMTFGWQVKPTLRMKLSAENLLDEYVVFRQGEHITRKYSPGRQIGLSVNFSRRSRG